MSIALRMPVPVLPGRRIEFASPDLPENGTVEVIVLLPDGARIARSSMQEIAESVPAGPRPYTDWEEYDRARRDDRAAWDR